MKLLALLVTLWEVLGRLFLSAHARNFVALPSDVVHEAWQLTIDGELAAATAHTALRVALGAGLGGVGGVIFGALVGFPGAGAALAAPLALARSIPPIAWIPLTLLWFGVGEAQVVVVLAGATFHVVTPAAADALGRVPVTLLQAAENLGATPARLVALRIRAATPAVLGALVDGVAMAWFVVVAAEFVSAAEGLGVVVLQGRDLLLPGRTFVGMAALGICGLASDRALRAARGRLVRWA